MRCLFLSCDGVAFKKGKGPQSCLLARSEPAEVPLGLNLLLLGLDLELLLGDLLLLDGHVLEQLSLLGELQVTLVGGGLLGHGVEDGGDGLAIDDGLGDGGGGGDELSLKKRCNVNLKLGIFQFRYECHNWDIY